MRPKHLSASSTLVDLEKTKYYIVETAGIVTTLPVPKYYAPTEGVEFRDNSGGWSTIAAPSGYYFTGSIQNIVLGPYQSVRIMRVSPLSGTTETNYYAAFGNHIRSEELITYSPTFTWGTADPSPLTTSSHAWVIDGVCFFVIYASTTDGNGADSLTVTLPLRPLDRDHYVPVIGQAIVDGTDCEILGHIDMADATNTNRVIEFDAWTTWTNAKSCSLYLAGFYEVPLGSWETWTNVETYGTSTWDTVTEVSRAKTLKGLNADGSTRSSLVAFISDLRSADAKGVTSTIAITTPNYLPDTNVYYPVLMHDKCTAGDDSVDYDNCLALLDSANATEASRKATSNAVGVMANGKAAEAYCAGLVEGHGWDSFTPTLTFTAATAPTMAANLGRYTVINGLCFFHLWATSTDGNGATALTIKLEGLPTPKYLGCKIPCAAMQTVNTTDSNPHAKLRADQGADADRPYINFDNLSTYTDATTASISVMGFYPV